MRRLPWLAAVAALTGAASPLRAEPLELPIELDNNLIFVAVRLNGEDRSFILDTGAYTLIDERAARAAGLGLKQVGQTDGIGSQAGAPVYLAATARVEIGGVEVPIQAPLVTPLAGVEGCFNKGVLDEAGRGRPLRPEEPGRPRRIDGILGRELFNAFIVQIDYPARRLRIYPNGEAPVTNGETLPLELTAQHMFVPARVAANGKAPVEARLEVDTGYAVPLSLNRPFTLAHGLEPPREAGEEAPGCGLNGETAEPSLMASADRLDLGGLSIAAPVTEYSRSQQAEAWDGFLGGAALRRWRVTVSVPARTLVLEQP